MTDTAFSIWLSKLVPQLFYPLGAAIVLALLGVGALSLDRKRLAGALMGAAAALLWICSMPAVAHLAAVSLERQYPPVAMDKTPAADVAIVLGGAIGQPVPPRVELDLSDAADRVLHAAHLYRAGKVARILVTGGNLPWLEATTSEAALIKRLLVEWGVPADRIAIAGASRNTHENALEILALRRAQPFSSALLVTSAMHMPRAIAVFRHAGLPVIASTTDVTATGDAPITLLGLLPDAGALAGVTAALKEWAGLLVYRARGWA